MDHQIHHGQGVGDGMIFLLMKRLFKSRFRFGGMTFRIMEISSFLCKRRMATGKSVELLLNGQLPSSTSIIIIINPCF
jgi:hypothetical protein